MTVVILCGGLGTRAYPYTRRTPKALMEVAGAPIVEQVMRIYASHGYRDFLLSVGYLKDAIVDYFESRKDTLGWRVRCIDTGENTDTGGRIVGCRDYVTPTFHATYCDGLGDIDLDALLAFHRTKGGGATMTAVALRSQYGLVYADDSGCATHFEEKPILPDRLINAGFFVFDASVLDDWSGENLEREVLPSLADKRRLYIFKHAGFWRSMDTLKDQQELTPAWREYATRYLPRVSATDGREAGVAAGGGT